MRDFRAIIKECVPIDESGKSRTLTSYPNYAGSLVKVRLYLSAVFPIQQLFLMLLSLPDVYVRYNLEISGR